MKNEMHCEKSKKKLKFSYGRIELIKSPPF